MSDAYDRVKVGTYSDGSPMLLNKRTLAALKTAQARTGADDDWTIFQGSYHRGTSQSAGTHDGGGAIDLSPFNADQRVHALRAVGFAAWLRLAIPGVWDEHIHVILIGDREMSSSAREQVTQFRNHQNGLADHGPDNTWRPKPEVVFDYPAYLKEQARLKARAQRARAALANAIKALVRARKNTDSKARKAQIQRFIESLRDKH